MGIRAVPDAENTLPPVIAKYLLPKERQVITVRLHPATLIRPVAETLAGLVLATVLSLVPHMSDTARLVIWLAWVVVLLRFGMKFWEWWDNHFIVTSKRLLLVTGVITKKVNMIPLGKVTDMSFQRSPMGQLLGYGEFIVESAGKDHALSRVDHLPYPEQLYLEVCGLIFTDGDD